MSNEFAYECPHCHETVRISDDVLGEVVDCPVCESPFRVDIPTATPTDASLVNESTPSLDRPERTESELKNVHPAMFRSHPVRFLAYSALLIGGLVLIFLALANREFFSQTVQIVVGGLLAAAAGIFFLKWFIETRWTTLIVTTKRTILRRGIIARQTSEVQHDDVRNIQVDQNIYERLVNVGDIAVSSSGQDELEILVRGIPQPEEVAETIRDLQ